jgi:hypothetical protein
MPAHLSHILFAEEALRRADGEHFAATIRDGGGLFYFGAQGPDFFYHNQRTRPTGLRYGALIHRRSYGTLLANMAGVLVDEAVRQGTATDPRATAYLLGFATHGALDRSAHPYIVCRAGWVRHDDASTQHLFRMHAFLERLLDVVLLQERAGITPAQMDFFSRAYCGETLPYVTIKMLLKGINATYPDAHYKSRDRRRIENAYADSIRFYAMTDPRNPHRQQFARKRDAEEGFRHRRMSVFHPQHVPPDLDVANLHHSPWPHPCAAERLSTTSYLDMFDAALDDVVPALAALADGLHRLRLPAELGAQFGEKSLNATLDGATCMPESSAPLPLSKLLETLSRGQ